MNFNLFYEGFRLLGLLLVVGSLCGCDPNMGLSEQSSFTRYEMPEALQKMKLKPENSEVYQTNETPKIAVNLELLEVGRKYYVITCSPCHGTLGRSDGEILAHGFAHPPKSLLSPDQRNLSLSSIYHTITFGKGDMLQASDQLNERQRWAVAHYVKALQKIPLPQTPKEPNCVD